MRGVGSRVMDGWDGWDEMGCDGRWATRWMDRTGESSFFFFDAE